MQYVDGKREQVIGTSSFSISTERFLARVVSSTISALGGRPSHVGGWVSGSAAVHCRKSSRREPSGAGRPVVPLAGSAATSWKSVSKLCRQRQSKNQEKVTWACKLCSETIKMRANRPLLGEDGGHKRIEQALVNVVVDAATIHSLRQQRAQSLPWNLVGRHVGAGNERGEQKKKTKAEKQDQV